MVVLRPAARRNAARALRSIASILRYQIYGWDSFMATQIFDETTQRYRKRTAEEKPENDAYKWARLAKDMEYIIEIAQTIREDAHRHIRELTKDR